jgi:hypothetical protein
MRLVMLVAVMAASCVSAVGPRILNRHERRLVNQEIKTQFANLNIDREPVEAGLDHFEIRPTAHQPARHNAAEHVGLYRDPVDRLPNTKQTDAHPKPKLAEGKGKEKQSIKEKPKAKHNIEANLKNEIFGPEGTAKEALL